MITLLYNEAPLLGVSATIAPIVALYYKNNLLAAILLVVLIFLIFSFRYTADTLSDTDDSVIVCPANGVITRLLQTDYQTYITIFTTVKDERKVVYPANSRVLMQNTNMLPTQYNDQINKNGYLDTLNEPEVFMLGNVETTKSKNNMQASLLRLANGATLRLTQESSFGQPNNVSYAYAGQYLGLNDMYANTHLLIPAATPSKYKTPDYKQFYLADNLKVGDCVKTGMYLGEYR
jgi:hypothetical protein